MQSIRRGLKRKEPEGGEEYQAGLTQFQVNSHRKCNTMDILKWETHSIKSDYTWIV